MRRIIHVSLIAILCIICIMSVSVLGLLVAAKGPLMIGQHKNTVDIPVREGSEIAHAVKAYSGTLTPYYLSISTDASNDRVVTVCCFGGFLFEDNYLIKQIDISKAAITESWYWGETRSLQTLFPYSVVTDDPDFYQHLLTVIAAADGNDTFWIYCDGFVFESEDGENYSLYHTFGENIID